MSKISENLKLIRLIRGYSVRQVAQKVERSPGTISNWENGKISPDVDTFAQLCELYNVPPNQILGWEACPDIDEFLYKQTAALKTLEELKAKKAKIDSEIKAINELLSRNAI